MTESAYLLLGLTAVVGGLVGVLAFAILRFVSGVRQLRGQRRDAGAETAFMATAVEEAVARLRGKERAMQARAEASERLSDEIIASMTSGLLVVGRDGEVRTLNPAGRRLLGLPESQPAGQFRDALSRALPLATVVQECLSSGAPIVRRALELKGERAEGAASHLGVTASPIRDGGGTVQGAICLFSDLSAIVELEEQLRLKDSLARLGELTAGIAHEFRNGLATIHGYSRLLDLNQLPSNYRPYVEGIRQETEALGRVVANFLNFARPAELTLASVDMRTLTERVADDLRHDVIERGGQLQVLGEFACVEGDEVLLRQALGNLCRNALEACAESGAPPAIVLEGSVDTAQGMFRLVVEDNGPGIAPAIQDRLFRPFCTTKPGGTGLGLALVQKTVVMHNGRVTAGQAASGGARLQISLPLGGPTLPQLLR